MTDIIDLAQALELAENERNQAKAIMPIVTRPSEKWCKAPGCGERIPEARREAVPGVQFCTECQAHIERMKGKSRHDTAN